MNITLLNTINLDDGSFIKKGGGIKLNNQEKTVDVRENGTITVVPDKDFTGLNKVSVNVNVGEDLLADAIRFIDYDGTILYTYSPQEIEQMTELPPLPSHEGLICQEWNYTLEEIKQQPLFCEVGATYITDDGATRVEATFTDTDNIFRFGFYARSNSGNVHAELMHINWGDGSEQVYYNEMGSGGRTLGHQYAPGTYTISIKPIAPATIELGYGDNQIGFIDGTNYYSNNSAPNAHVTAVFIGNVTKVTWHTCKNLEKITIPKNTYVGPIYGGKLTGLVCPRGASAAVSYYSSSGVDSFRISMPMPAGTYASTPTIEAPGLERYIIPYSDKTSEATFYSSSCRPLATDVMYGINGSGTPLGCLKIFVMDKRATYIPSYAENLILLNEEVLRANATSGYAGRVWIIKNKRLESCYNVNIVGSTMMSYLGRLPISQITINNNSMAKQLRGSATIKQAIIGENVTSLEYNLFKDCYTLEKVIFNNEKITTIPSDAFRDCKSLTEITLPKNITNIGGFSGCASLKHIVIPDTVTKIDGSAFQDCSSLTSVSIPESVTEIGSGAFSRCLSLVSLTIPDLVTSIGTKIADYCRNLQAFYGKYASSDNRCIIIDGVLKAFAPAGLTKYTLPSEVTNIETTLQHIPATIDEITLNDGITTIPANAFEDAQCMGIVVPNSVVEIGNSAFGSFGLNFYNYYVENFQEGSPEYNQ